MYVMLRLMSLIYYVLSESWSTQEKNLNNKREKKNIIVSQKLTRI